ncbi:gamma-glutamylcyclotransferase family protein [Endothiovibrio diazotrophicus]
MTTNSLPLLFAYGTLMRGQPMHRMLAPHGRFVARASVAGRLLLLDGYPGAVAAAVEGERVFGELYRLHHPARSLPWLDRYEGCLPRDPRQAEYRRVVVEAVSAGGRRHRAWIYLYQGRTGGRPPITDGDFRHAPVEPLRHAHALACR